MMLNGRVCILASTLFCIGGLAGGCARAGYSPEDASSSGDDFALTTDSIPPYDLATDDRSGRKDGAGRMDRSIADAGGTIVLNEIFSGPVTIETDGIGNWVTSKDVLTQTTCMLSATDSSLTGGDWADVSVTTRVHIDQICGVVATLAGLLFRVSSISQCNNSYYACIIDPTADTLGLAVFNGSCLLNYMAKKSASISPGEWYELKSTAVGAEIGCELHGVDLPVAGVAVNWTDPAPLTSGTVGYMAGQLSVSFDDLVVRMF